MYRAKRMLFSSAVMAFVLSAQFKLWSRVWASPFSQPTKFFCGGLCG
jgi:hypothetical protein